MGETSRFDWVTILVIVVTGIVSYAVAIVVERFKNRRLILRKKVIHTIIGQSNSNSKWGDIAISYNGNKVNNLFLFTVEIRNNSLLDAPANMPITFSVSEDCFFLRGNGVLRERTSNLTLQGEPVFISQFNDVMDRWGKLRSEFQNADHPLYKELTYVMTHRVFVLPVLNRNTFASFELLVGGNALGDIPNLAIGIYEKGIGIEWLDTPEKKQKRKLIAETITTFYFIASIFPITWYAPSVAWAAWITCADVFFLYLLAKVIDSILRAMNM